MRGREGVGDDLSHAIQIFQNIIVPEAKDTIAFAFEERRSRRISQTVRMLAAVSFDDQPTLLANEVGNERPDRLLTTEFCSSQLAVAQHSPKHPFRIGHLAP